MKRNPKSRHIKPAFLDFSKLQCADIQELDRKCMPDSKVRVHYAVFDRIYKDGSFLYDAVIDVSHDPSVAPLIEAGTFNKFWKVKALITIKDTELHLEWEGIPPTHHSNSTSELVGILGNEA